jgi:hypothetical protein
MANDKFQSVKVTTPKFRVSFPHLHEPAGMEGQEKKYSVVMLFAKDSDMSWAKNAIAKVLTERFGADKAKWPKGMKNPIRDGDEKETPLAGYEGHYYLTARSKDKPGVVDAKCNDILDVRDEMYAGCFARATVAFYYYDKAGNRGIGIALNNLQKMGDGEKFSGKAAAKDEFDKVEGSEGAGNGSNDELFD